MRAPLAARSETLLKFAQINFVLSGGSREKGKHLLKVWKSLGNSGIGNNQTSVKQELEPSETFHSQSWAPSFSAGLTGFMACGGGIHMACGEAYTWNGGSKMENRMCRSGSRPGEQKGVVGTLAIYIKQNSLFILSPVSLLKVLQLLLLEPHKLQVNLEDAHWYSWVNAYGSICAGELQWSWNVYFKSLKSPKFTSSLASMLSSCSFLGSHNFHAVCFGSSSLLNC